MKFPRALGFLAVVLVLTPLAHADSTTMRFNGVNGANDGTYYVSPYTGTINQAAWFVLQFGSHHGDYVSLQYALWDLMTPGSEPTSYSNADGITVAQWVALASANYGQVNPNNFEIITNVGPLAYTGQVQEFVTPVATPEPASLLLLLVGVFVLALFFSGRPQQPA